MKQADPNRKTLDPDTLVKGIMPFMKLPDEYSLSPLFDFLTRYVRKLHSDRHIKNTLTASPGMSFLDMIGASDVAYVICVIKNNYAVWSYDPTDPTTTEPKPLYTRGESKKREYGKTTFSKEGMTFFNKGLLNWKKVFSDREGPIFKSMAARWDEWLMDNSGAVDSAGWKRKNICTLLRAREVDSDGAIDDGAGSGEEQGNEETEGYCYDSDGEVNLVQHNGHMRRVTGATVAGMKDNAEDDEDGDDDLEDGDEDDEEEESRHPMEDNRKRPYNAEDKEDEEKDKEQDEEEEEEEEEEQKKKSGRNAGAGKNKKGNGKGKDKDKTGQVEPSSKRTRKRGKWNE